MRKQLIVLALLLTVLPVGQSGAQENWFTYLYNSVSKELVRVNLDGTQQTYNLGLPENVFVNAGDMTFTNDGARVAFCALQYSENSSQATATLYIRDIAGGANTLEQGMGSAVGCLSRYSDDNTMLAVSIVRYLDGDPAADTSQPIWELMLLDPNTGGTMMALNAARGAVSETGALMPLVRYFRNNQVIFNMVFWGAGGAPSNPAYLWNLSDDGVFPIDRWGEFGLSSLDETGELVWLTNDPNLPAADPGGPLPANNVALVSDSSGAVNMIYHNPDWVIVDTRYIDGGERLAIMELEAFDPNNPPEAGQQTRWVGLDRLGNVSELRVVPLYSDIADAPGGFVLLWLENQTGWHLEHHTDEGLTQLWSWMGDPMTASWEMAWAQPTTIPTDLPPFPIFGERLPAEG